MPDVRIPIYAGGYDMAADADAAECDEWRSALILEALTSDERMAIRAALRAATGEWPTLDEADAAYLAAITERWPELSQRSDVRLSFERFQAARTRMESRYATVAYR